MLGGIDGSQIEVDLSMSILWDSDGTDRSVESLGVFGAGLEAFDKGDGDDDCEKGEENCSKNSSMFLSSLSCKERGGVSEQGEIEADKPGHVDTGNCSEKS